MSNIAVRSVQALLIAVLLTGGFALAQSPGYREITWTDLLPPEDLDALWNPPQWLSEIDEGSELDDVDALLSSDRLASEAEERYFQALTSARVRPEFEGEQVRIPGFVVPLEFDEQRRVTEFFLVPFFGACIHYPPPPPNQIIYVSHPAGLPLSNLWDPYWVEGTVQLELISNELGDAAYTLADINIYLYDGP